MLALLKEQPKAFRMIFLLELWERFGFYTVQGILTLYFIRQLGFSETEAYQAFGAFSALVYGLVAIGGYLGDRQLGTKRTIVLGLGVLALGYLSLSLTDKSHVFLALGIICVGNGLFKANPSNLLAKCYRTNDPRLHSGFTLYYMAINLGSSVALIIGPLLSSTLGYFYAYFASFIGLLLGLANYFYQRQLIADIQTEADNRVISSMRWAVIGIGILLTIISSAYLLQHVILAKRLLLLMTVIILLIYFNEMRVETKSSRIKMLVALVLMGEAVMFFILYQQMPTSLNLFAVNNVTPYLFGISIDAQSFQALNPFWIILLSPLLSFTYQYLNKKNIGFAIPYKFALGMLMCGLSFLLLYFSRYFHNVDGMVSSWWLVLSYLFQSTGELLVSALGVAMIAELVPIRMVGFVMGMWFLTSSLAGFIGATVASYTAIDKQISIGVDSLIIYTNVFASIGGLTLVLGLVMWAVAPRLRGYIEK